MLPLSPRFVALPAAVLAIIIGLAQANSQVPSPAEEEAGTGEISVHRVTSCAAPTKTLVTICAIADDPDPSVAR